MNSQLKGVLDLRRTDKILTVENLKDNYWVGLAMMLALFKLVHKYYYYFIVTGKHIFLWDLFGISGPDSIYRSFSFSVTALGNIYFLPVIILSGWLFIRSGRTSWNSISAEFLKPTRILILFAAIISTWQYGFSGYNYYFDHSFYLDRLILILFCLGMIRYTWLIPAFIGVVLLWVAQFGDPLEQGSLLDKNIIYESMILFVCYLMIRSFYPLKNYFFWMLLFCMIGSNYYIAALDKLKLGDYWYQWMTEDKLWVHTTFAHVQGWMNSLSEEKKTAIVSFVKANNIRLLISTMIIEFSAFFILLNRKSAAVILILCSFFHLGVFLESGIFFWKWILLNFTIAFLLIRFRGSFSSVFTRLNFVVSLVLIFFSLKLFFPTCLGWWDIPYATDMKYEVTDETGQTYEMPGNQLCPYEQSFTFHNFNYLIPDSVCVPRVERKNIQYMNDQTGMEAGGFRQWMETVKVSTFDKKQYEMFDEFMQTYISNYNERISTSFFLSKFSSPDHIYTSRFVKNPIPAGHKIKKFRIRFLQYFFDQKQLHTLTDNYIYEKNYN